jgi:hypothetical protein
MLNVEYFFNLKYEPIVSVRHHANTKSASGEEIFPGEGKR